MKPPNTRCEYGELRECNRDDTRETRKNDVIKNVCCFVMRMARRETNVFHPTRVARSPYIHIYLTSFILPN